MTKKEKEIPNSRFVHLHKPGGQKHLKMKVKSIVLTLALSALACPAASSNPSSDSENNKYVLTFGSNSLEHVENVVRESGVKVERFLKCTRGILLSSIDSEEAKELLSSQPDMKLLPLSAAQHPNFGSDLSQDRRGLNPVYTCADGCPSSATISELSVGDIETIKSKIKENIALDSSSFAGSKTDSVGELLRLIFHDVSAFNKNLPGDLSGLNGCVNMTFASNAGLQPSLDFLSSVKAETGIAISDADMFVLGAIAAIESGGGPDSIPFHYGRIDIPCECETDFFPDPESSDARTSTAELDNTMVDRNGFTRRETAALVSSDTLFGRGTQFQTKQILTNLFASSHS